LSDLRVEEEGRAVELEGGEEEGMKRVACFLHELED
jgi:hypothetical protein